MKHSISRRTRWLTGTAAAALASAALRLWQLNSAFEEFTGLAVPGAQASVILTCVLLMAGAWLMILSLSGGALPAGRRWNQVFLSAGGPAYPALEISAAFFAITAVPVLFIVGVEQFRIYQDMLASGLQPPNSNGLLTLATAGGAFLAALGLLQTGRDSLRPGRRGRAGFSAVLPGVAGCAWLAESFQSHAANPVRWDYAPQLLAIMLGMAFYMDFAGMSAGAARPRRLLWMAAMTAVFSAVALVTAASELIARADAELSLCCAQLGDVLLLLSQTLAAAGVLWRLPPSLDGPSEPVEPSPDLIPEIQEDADNE